MPFVWSGIKWKEELHEHFSAFPGKKRENGNQNILSKITNKFPKLYYTDKIQFFISIPRKGSSTQEFGDHANEACDDRGCESALFLRRVCHLVIVRWVPICFASKGSDSTIIPTVPERIHKKMKNKYFLSNIFQLCSYSNFVLIIVVSKFSQMEQLIILEHFIWQFQPFFVLARNTYSSRNVCTSGGVILNPASLSPLLSSTSIKFKNKRRRKRIRSSPIFFVGGTRPKTSLATFATMAPISPSQQSFRWRSPPFPRLLPLACLLQQMWQDEIQSLKFMNWSLILAACKTRWWNEESYRSTLSSRAAAPFLKPLRFLVLYVM